MSNIRLPGQHARTCPAYGNYQPPYEECNCHLAQSCITEPDAPAAETVCVMTGGHKWWRKRRHGVPCGPSRCRRCSATKPVRKRGA